MLERKRDGGELKHAARGGIQRHRNRLGECCSEHACEEPSRDSQPDTRPASQRLRDESVGERRARIRRHATEDNVSRSRTMENNNKQATRITVVDVCRSQRSKKE